MFDFDIAPLSNQVVWTAVFIFCLRVILDLITEIDPTAFEDTRRVMRGYGRLAK